MKKIIKIPLIVLGIIVAIGLIVLLVIKVGWWILAVIGGITLVAIITTIIVVNSFMSGFKR